MKKTLLFFAVASCTALAQITITSSDLANAFAVGNGITIHADTLLSTVDIGTPGGGNNWDFTMFQSNLQISYESVDPASTPHIGDFPGADYATHSIFTAQGTTSNIWSYLLLNGTFDNMGSAIEIDILPGVTTIKNNPARRQAVLPYTFNSQWTQTYEQTLLFNGIPIFTSTVSLSAIVDAYGTMTIPGGASYEVLRVREEQTISGITGVFYAFIASNGAQVTVTPVDANPPNTGTINVEETNYNGALATTGVEQISGLPNDYDLSQNYPNPFNPSTNIEYSIPSESFVELKVYDVLGNEIASLVNEQQQAGVYRADFTADNLPSGMYFARIRANEFTQVVKMILLK